MTVVGRTRLLAALLFATGGGAALFAGYQLREVFRGFDTRAPSVTFDAIDGTGLLAGIGVLIIAVVLLLPANNIAEKGRPSHSKAVSRPTAAKPLMLIAAACIALSPLAPSLLRAAVASVAEGRGYVHCPALIGVRRHPELWTSSTLGRHEGCPTEPPR